MNEPHRVEIQAEERWRKAKERKKSLHILQLNVLEFYDCAYCGQSYAIMPDKCIKCNHHSFEIIGVRICHLYEDYTFMP